jgi:putative transposase
MALRRMTAKPDVAAAKCFFQQAMNGNGTPWVITMDAYAASHRAIREPKAEGKMPKRVRVCSSKYLNKWNRARSSSREATNPSNALL